LKTLSVEMAGFNYLSSFLRRLYRSRRFTWCWISFIIFFHDESSRRTNG